MSKHATARKLPDRLVPRRHPCRRSWQCQPPLLESKPPESDHLPEGQRGSARIASARFGRSPLACLTDTASTEISAACLARLKRRHKQRIQAKRSTTTRKPVSIEPADCAFAAQGTQSEDEGAAPEANGPPGGRGPMRGVRHSTVLTPNDSRALRVG